MIRWTLTLATIAVVAATLVLTGLYNSTAFGHVGKIYFIVSVTGCALLLIHALSGVKEWNDDLDNLWDTDERTERLIEKLARANERAHLFEGKFRTVKHENNLLRRFNHRLADNLTEANNRLADVINQAASDQKRYEAEIASLTGTVNNLSGTIGLHADKICVKREIPL